MRSLLSREGGRKIAGLLPIGWRRVWQRICDGGRRVERMFRRAVPRQFRLALKMGLRRFERAVRGATPAILRKGIRPIARLVNPRYRRLAPQASPVHPAQPGIASSGNKKHVDSEQLVRLVVLSDDPAVRNVWAHLAMGDWYRIADPRDYVASASDYVICPPDCEHALSPAAIRSAYLCASSTQPDILIISTSADAAPAITIRSRRDNVIVRGGLYSRLLDEQSFPSAVRGKVLRLPAERTLADSTRTLGEVLRVECCVKGQEFFTGSSARAPRSPDQRTRLPSLDDMILADDRPLILVLPGIFAVGGVERNTIEILRELQDRYRFVLATTEPHLACRGSLHHQVSPLCEAIYDLGEIAPPRDHIEILLRLHAIHRFECIWIVNGSTWLSENLSNLRDAFAAIPIIDQQVYDTTHGWISCYNNPAIRSYDRYVAINRKIAEAFEQRFGLESRRIALIYHAIDSAKWQRVAALADPRNTVRERWSIPPDAAIIGFIGRLTAQKQPLQFLDLARRSLADGRPEVFLLVGDGDRAEECRAYIEQHRLTNVRMTGFLDDPSAVIAGLAGLVITSSYEGLPIVSLEAMASGIPVLTTDVGDLRLVCDRFQIGTFFDERDAESVGAEGHRYAAYLDWRARWKEHKARAKEGASGVQRAFDSRAIAGQYDDVFRSAMSAIQTTRIPCRASVSSANYSSDYASISVVMPTWNRCDSLKKVLQRFTEIATGLDYELVVVDDGSTDGTADLLQQVSRADPRVRCCSVSNGGPGQARNKGADLAQKDVVLFVGDDIIPCDERFMRTHARLHAANRGKHFAVLGKVVWPSDGAVEVNAVMRHIQGWGGEQFGYAHLQPYRDLDWRFFYTCNVSVKRDLVSNWLKEGFSADFHFAAFEDGEFAYRMSKKKPPLRLYYDPAAIAEHHHIHTIKTFLDRQFSVGMMAAVMLSKHPELAKDLGLKDLVACVSHNPREERTNRTSDVLSILEGIRSFAAVLEGGGGLGNEHWHAAFMQALFEMVMRQGFVVGWSKKSADTTAGYEYILAQFLHRVAPIVAVETPGMTQVVRALLAQLKAA